MYTYMYIYIAECSASSDTRLCSSDATPPAVASTCALGGVVLSLTKK